MKSFAALSRAFAETPLFSGKTWKVAADAWRFSAEETRELNLIGDACLAFYRAQEKLYRASATGRSLLRNAPLYAPWVAEILDCGKPARLIAHQRTRALAGTIPDVIRPDLLITENGFALTELDSVPGGIGLTAFLEDAYLGSTAMPERFFATLVRGDYTQNVALAVSDESADYRPEFEYLAARLRRTCGAKINVCHPNELCFSEDGVWLAGERVDVVYRFFELFDGANFPAREKLMEAVERGQVRVSPPMRAFQEEKMSLALFRHPALDAFWREHLAEAHREILQKIIPATWILEPVEALPASALLWAPKPMRDWDALAALPRRERNYVLKASGFSEEAWGARSVTVGDDASQNEWAAAVARALDAGRRNSLYVLQDFKKPSRVNFGIFDDAGTSVAAVGRVRICPYYFTDGQTAHLAGALATVCPADKKIIHGMRDAALAPCVFEF